MNNTPKFSIIVPVYNVEKYLTECINSILSQSFSNYELLIIDDGSTDSSGNICDTYVTHKNVKVFHKENGGLSDARNYGIKEAIGEYIIFVDSDDFWSDTLFLDKINDKIMAYNPDLVIFGYKKLYEDRVIKKYIPKMSEEKDYNIEYILQKGIFRICAWDKVVKRELILNNNIDFRIGVIGEDMEWCAKLYSFSNKVAILCSSSYMYRQREGSITKVISEKNIIDVMNNFNLCLDLIILLSPKKALIYKKFLANNFSMFIILLSLIDKNKQKKYYSFIKSNIPLLYKGRIREKIIFFSLKIFGIYNTELLLGFLNKKIK
ncbi:glycosyltransferase family 2 protein [Gallibacterium anatis]|uniref:glycosyltransferase family 2 protein n=1 Tax=Gallibacterium anatis TaxID=750 RepID=UPI0030053873